MPSEAHLRFVVSQADREGLASIARLALENRPMVFTHRFK